MILPVFNAPQTIHRVANSWSFASNTPFRRKCASRPWCYALRLPTANRRGAICGIRPDKRASRCECSWLSCRRQFIASAHTRIQHVFYKYSIAFRRVGYHYMGNRTHELAVLNDCRAWHECDQVGTTIFYKKFIFATIKCSFVENSMYLCSKFSI